MKKIQILGTGCPKCKRLYANTEAALKSAGIEAQIEKVEKIVDIMKFGVMSTPALVVDGVVKSVAVEEPGKFEVSSAEAMLARL